MGINSEDLRRRLEAVEDLPTLPSVVSEILDLTRNPHSDASAIGKILSQDQALTAKVLKLVNSSFYGFPSKIKTITHAIVILGFTKVKNIAIATSVFDMVRAREQKAFSIPEFWEHSLGTAIAARTISRITKIGEAEEAFVSGLVHDIGKIILLEFASGIYNEVLDEKQESDTMLVEAEDAVMGLNHSLVGSWIAERWKLPDNIQRCIKFHHCLDKIRGDRELVSIIHLADIMARAINVGNGGDVYVPALEQDAISDLKLKPARIDVLMEAFAKELSKAKAFFELIEKGE